MAKGNAWREQLAARDPVENAFISSIWLLPLIGLVTCSSPGPLLYLVMVAVVVAVEGGFAWFAGRRVPWVRLLVAAALGGLLGLGIAYLVWSLAAPHCPLAFWQILLFAIAAALLATFTTSPFYRRVRRV